MKKIFALVLAVCFVFTFAAESFAAAKPTITKQPETATTSKKGTVSFSITVKGKVGSYTWYFINPANGEKLSGQKLAKAGLGVKVQNPNSKKVTLTNVPESMHGWEVYCHVNGNGYKVDSEKVLLLVYGMEPPGSIAAPAEESPVSTESVQTPAESTPEDQASSEAGQISQEQTPAENADSTPVDPDDIPSSEPDKYIIVSSSYAVLRKLDAMGNIVEMEPTASLEFLNTGSFIVTSDDPIKSWTVNGIRFEPADPVREFKVLNVREDTTVSILIERSSAAPVVLDADHKCKVSCKGCTFTFLSAGFRSATEGEVPSGAPIRIVADTSDNAAKGYIINGQEAVNQGITSFVFTVTEDIEVVIP